MRSVIVAFPIALALFVVIILGADCSWLGMSLKREVRPVEALNLVVTLFIAFFLQRFFTVRINDVRAEKNLLIAQCSDLLKLLSAVNDVCLTLLRKDVVPPETPIWILSKMREISNSITDLYASAEQSKLRSIKPLLQELWRDYRDLKRAATGGGFPSRGYSIEERSAQDKHFRALAIKLRNLVFVINRAKR